VAAVLERGPVADQVTSPSGAFPLGPDLGVGSQISGPGRGGTARGRTQASIRSVLEASGPGPLTFWASAMATG
jgi:hypothetical protein